MLISTRYQFLFIAISKTGTSSMEQALAPHCAMHGFDKHLRYRNLPNDVRGLADEYFKFSFVRNPWDRVVSQYFQSRKPKALHVNRRRQLYELANSLDFPSWIKALNKGELNTFLHSLSMYRCISNETNNIAIDFVGRFERLQRDFQTILDVIGLPTVSLSHANRSPREQDYHRYYDCESRDIVAEVFREDIEAFGYKY